MDKHLHHQVGGVIAHYKNMEDNDHTTALNAEHSNNNNNDNEEEEVLNNINNDTFKDYLSNIYYISELVFCILVAVLGHIAPKIIFSLTERDIPYLQTVNGDVILDQYINRQLIQKETVSALVLIAVCGVAPLCIMLLFSFFFGYKHDLHSSTCLFLFAFGCTQFNTNFVKLYCGYWRPNFYNYCAFNSNNLDCEAENQDVLDETRKSFPSGHASIAFSGMMTITLFFWGKIGLFCSHHHEEFRLKPSTCNASIGANLFKKRILSIIVSLHMLIAVFIAASRVHDDFHHPADVVAGAVIGMSCAIFSYRLWYSPLSSEFSGYSINTAHDICRSRRMTYIHSINS